MLTRDYGTQVNRITTQNPQANSIVESASNHWEHNSDMICWRSLIGRIQPLYRTALRRCDRTKATLHTTLIATISQLVFGLYEMLSMEFKGKMRITDVRTRKKACQY